MAYGVMGFRSVIVKLNSTGDWLDQRGAIAFVEVTNNGASDVTFTPNGFDSADPTDPNWTGMLAESGIPIKAGATRQIPMQMYNFKASGAVDVVAYRV